MSGFRDPLDEEADAAEGAGKRSKELADRMGSRPAPEPDEVEVQEPDEEDEELEEVKATASRKDKRAARSTARERLAAAEAREQVLREQLEITRRGAADRPAAQPTGNPVASIDAKITDANRRMAAVHAEWNQNAGRLSKEREAQLMQQAEQLEIEKMSLVVERRETLLAPQRERAETVRMLKQRAPDVYENPAALQYAQGLYAQKTAAGQPDSLETHDAVMEEARQVILGKRPRPDAAQRQRASGIGGGVGIAAAPGAAPKIPMTKGSQLYKLACATYPELDAAQACQKWANKNGKAYLERTGRR